MQPMDRAPGVGTENDDTPFSSKNSMRQSGVPWLNVWLWCDVREVATTDLNLRLVPVADRMIMLVQC